MDRLCKNDKTLSVAVIFARKKGKTVNEDPLRRYKMNAPLLIPTEAPKSIGEPTTRAYARMLPKNPIGRGQDVCVPLLHNGDESLLAVHKRLLV